ncbi:unnamed protein product [Medioppia subpectinata]|uniref:Uncharacterized protein n=1 Tax=Medioppia subpectinata TaxID=1979941 RepID=A0A7R9KF70_9ACAR|nr:unnamed protein product [Medioppia subpectinata]CAG2102231.1 unnamed protein product [Medioppia subpectinata]
MMKGILSVMIVLYISYQCMAGSDWAQFRATMKTSVCQPDKTDNTLMGKIVECRKKHVLTQEKVVEWENKMKDTWKECAEGRDNDLSAYTKVDLKNDTNKRLLFMYCSDGYSTCVVDKIKKAKKEGEEDCNKKMTQEKKDEFQKCLTDAIKA